MPLAQELALVGLVALTVVALLLVVAVG